MLTPEIIASLGNLASNGMTVEYQGIKITPATVEAPKAAPEAPEAPKAAPEASNLIEIRSLRGHLLRSYDLSKLSKNGQKVARMMQVCASEGMHLWEMQHAIYCAEHSKNPTLPPDITTVSLYLTYDPMRNWNASYFRAALIEYVKARGSRLIARLKAI